MKKPFRMLCSVAMLSALTITPAYALDIEELSLEVNIPIEQTIKQSGFAAEQDSEIIAQVDDWSITQADLDYRIKEHQAAGNNDSSNDIMNILFEEATLFSLAEDLGVLPTNEDVENFLNDMCKDSNIAESIANQNVMTPDMLKFYAFKGLAYDNVYHYYLNEGRKLGLITPQWTYDETELAKYPYGNGDDYFHEKVLEYKEKIAYTTTINFEPDTDKIVLLKESNDKIQNNQIFYTEQDMDQIIGNPEEALTTKASFNDTVSATGNGKCSGIAQDWGYFSLEYSVGYRAEENDEYGEQYIGKQDLVVTSTAVGKLNPELRSRVSGGAIHYSEAFTSTGKSVGEFWGFNQKLWGSYIYSYMVWGNGAYGGTLGKSGSYYMQATAGIFVDDYLKQDGQTITVKSNNF